MANHRPRSPKTLQVPTACKEKLWRRWQREYLTALRERHNLTYKVNKFQPKCENVVIVKSDNKNRGTWQLAIVNQVYPGKDGIICAVQLKTTNGALERLLQHLYPQEFECGLTPAAKLGFNSEAPDFRPRTDAAVAAKLRMKHVSDVEHSEL